MQEAKEQFMKEHTPEPTPVQESNLKLSYWPDPILKKATMLVENFDAELTKLAIDMRLKMQKFNGIGLAAPQVGKNISLLVVNVEDLVEEMVNPVISAESDGTFTDYEGCLSFPGLSIAVERPLSVEVKYQDLEGQWKTLELGGMKGRCVQHEIDHLNGITFMEYVTSKLRRDIYTRKMIKLTKRAKRYEQAVRKVVGSANLQG